MKHCFFIGLSLLLLGFIATLSISATIKSSGNVFFDANNNGQTDLTVNSDGVGINTSTISQKLNLSGNAAIMNGNLGVASSSPNSNLSLTGTWGMSVESVNSATTLSDNSIILVDTSSDNVTLQLPSAADNNGRIYHIKKKDDTNKVFISGGLIDGTADITITTQSTPLPFLEIISHDSQWFILSGNGYELGLSGNLIAWWTFDATSGNELIDRSGNGHSGNLQNFNFSSNTTAGRMGNALSFDGTDDYIDLGNADGLFVVSQVTMSCWYKIFTPSITIYEKSSTFGANHYTLSDSGFGGNPRPRWIVNSGFASYTVNANSTSEIDKVNWHHFLARYDGSVPQADIWVNGVQQTDIETPAATLSGTVATRRYTFIGASDFQGGLNGHFLGYLDDLRIYNKALSSDEIAQLFASGNAFQ